MSPLLLPRRKRMQQPPFQDYEALEPPEQEKRDGE